MIEHLRKIHRDISSVNFNTVLGEGMFFVDAGALLDLYRLPKTLSDDLISVLKHDNFRGRVWITFQTVVEFLNNRESVINDQEKKFSDVQAAVDKTIKAYAAAIQNLKKELNDMSLKKRHQWIDPDQYLTQESINESYKFLNIFKEKIGKLKNEVLGKSGDDRVLSLVLDFLQSSTSVGPSKDEVDRIVKEGEERYGNQIPPGYDDAAKPGAYTVGGIRFLCKYGDLFFWDQVIKKAKSSNQKYVIVVTSDLKGDWWLEKSGKKTGPRKELLDEIYTKAPEVEFFHMYDTLSFLKYANTSLGLGVNEDSIEDAREVLKLDRSKEWREPKSFGEGSEFGMTHEIFVKNQDGRPVSGAQVLLMSKNSTYKQGLSDESGLVRVSLAAGGEYALLVAHSSHEALLIKGLEPIGRTVCNIGESSRGGSIIVDGVGYIPGIEGRINPILDSLGRKYIYANNVAIEGGKAQPVAFELNEMISLEDSNGVVRYMRVVYMQGSVSLIQYSRE